MGILGYMQRHPRLAPFVDEHITIIRHQIYPPRASRQDVEVRDGLALLDKVPDAPDGHATEPGLHPRQGLLIPLDDQPDRWTQFLLERRLGYAGDENPSRNPERNLLIQESDMTSQDDATNGAVSEFADADLGDVRRTTRLVALAGVLAQHPTAALPEACGDGAMLKAAYRFLANEAIAPQDCLASQIEAPSSRVNHVPLVLAVKIPPKSIGPATRRPRAWGPWALRPVRGCWSTVRRRSRLRVSPGGCWPNRCGPVPLTTWASAPGASRGPSASRKASNGSPVWRPSAAPTRGVPRPGLSALATVQPRSTTGWRPCVRQVSRW